MTHPSSFVPAWWRRAPRALRRLPGQRWRAALLGALREFERDNLRDHAAALTYYAVLSLFPALLVFVSVFGIIGHAATDRLVTDLQGFLPGPARTVLVNAIHGLQDRQTSTWTAVAGALVALWTASGYVAAFMRASNVIYDVPEGRPFWKGMLQRLVLTMVILLLLTVCAVVVVFSGGLAQRTGNLLGLGPEALTAWSIAKWPVLVVAVVMILALLYWRGPNVRQLGFRWITPGSALAVLLWMAVSGLFAVYVANFAHYNKTYGSLAAVIIFLIWLWLTNLALLLGAEFDAELVRQRAEVGGAPANVEPYALLRDTRALSRQERREVADVLSDSGGRSQQS